ncbi:hypothetical protein WG66_003443, partial [Moniliophthora roreri]
MARTLRYYHYPINVDENFHKCKTVPWAGGGKAQRVSGHMTMFDFEKGLRYYHYPINVDENFHKCKTHGTLGGWGQRDMGCRAKGFRAYDNVWIHWIAKDNIEKHSDERQQLSDPSSVHNIKLNLAAVNPNSPRRCFAVLKREER